MKKKAYKVFAVFAAFALLLAGCGLLAGCEKTGDAAAVNSGSTLLTSFESYESVRYIGVSQGFGRLALNDDKDFVVNGEHSLALYPYGDFENGVAPRISIFADADHFFTADFSEFTHIAFDVYNSADQANAIEVWLTVEDELRNVSLTPVYSYELPAKAWSKSVYSLGGGAMAFGYSLDSVKTINIKLRDFRQTGGAWEPKPVYFDNMTGFKVSSAAYEREADELLFFENPVDLLFLNRSAGLTLTRNYNPLFVSQGNTSLMIEKTSADMGLLKINTAHLPPAFAAANGIAIDIFNNEGYAGIFRMQMRYTDRESNEEAAPIFFSQLIGGGRWGTLEIKKSELPEGYQFGDMPEIQLEILSGSVYVDNFRTTN
jgi:hypothetical protein